VSGSGSSLRSRTAYLFLPPLASAPASAIVLLRAPGSYPVEFPRRGLGLVPEIISGPRPRAPQNPMKREEGGRMSMWCWCSCSVSLSRLPVSLGVGAIVSISLFFLKVIVSISYRRNPQDYKSFSRKSLLARCSRIAGTKLEFGDLSRLTLVVHDFVWVILGFDVENCWKHDLDEMPCYQAVRHLSRPSRKVCHCRIGTTICYYY
jgi:hypothetical protein